MLGLLFPGQLPRNPARRTLHLGAEALAFAVISTWLPVTLGFEEAGLVSLFLLAAALSDRLTLLLEENRTSIYDRGENGWRANTRTAWGILVLFSGVLTGYAIVVLVLGQVEAASLFGFALRAAALGGESLARRDFGTVREVLEQNLRVLPAVACLSFVYRAYGAMLVVAWNASVWAVVLTILWLRDPAQTAGRAVLALAPHLLLEGLAYLTAALAFLFASKGLATHPLGDPKLYRVLRACGLLIAAACVALTLAAYAEVWIARAMLSSGQS